ncbi:MAG TPA: recombinase family protein [Acidimicrobiales bacterium]|nr:recombinase family protein [Acidimicrobiales bacterium]
MQHATAPEPNGRSCADPGPSPFRRHPRRLETRPSGLVPARPHRCRYRPRRARSRPPKSPEQADTTSPGGRFVFHLFGALAEFERDLIRERSMAGLALPRFGAATAAGPP